MTRETELDMARKGTFKVHTCDMLPCRELLQKTNKIIT